MKIFSINDHLKFDFLNKNPKSLSKQKIRGYSKVKLTLKAI